MSRTTLDDIHEWLAEAKKEKATHLIVVCDTFDWDDYPVYVLRGEKLEEKEKEYNNVNMQKIMGIFDMSKSIKKQLKEKGWILQGG